MSEETSVILSRIEEGIFDMNTNPFVLISLYFINPIISIFTSILIFVILKKYMPFMFMVLNGRIEHKDALLFCKKLEANGGKLNYKAILILLSYSIKDIYAVQEINIR